MLDRADGVLKSISPRGDADVSAWALLGVIVAAGMIYGGFMGSFAFVGVERLAMVLYAALKVPLLIAATTAVCLPAFYVLNAVAGLREDFGRVMRAVLAAQAALTAGLASLGPITRFVYFGGVSHRWALLTNALMFAAATLAGQWVLFTRYRGLIARRPRHRLMLWVWIAMYAFVGTQMGWMLRPFVGSPDKPVTFFREEPFSNAYVVVWRLVRG